MPLLPNLPAWSADHGLLTVLRAVEVAMAPSHLLVVGFVLAGACLLRGQVRVSVFVAATMWLTSYATTELKQVFGRERPPWQYAEHVHNGGSFPSGHSSAAAALVGVVVVLAFISTRDGRLQRRRTHAALVVGAIVMAVVAADRLLLGRHYPSDVLAGFALAAAATITAAVLTGVVPARRVETGSVDAGQSAGAPPLRDHRTSPADGDRRELVHV